jgi:hypothetical protein
VAKRIVERPWGTKRKGGWVIRIAYLIESLKKRDAVQLDKITIGTKPLIQLLRLLPGEYCQISANGRLEVETVQTISRKRKDGTRRVGYIKPKHYYNWFGLQDGAWLKPYMRVNPVVLKPRKI